MITLLSLLVGFCWVSTSYSQLVNGTLVNGTLVNAKPTAVGTACDSVNDSDLKAYWKFDEVSGNAIDSKGVNTLVDNNTVTAGTGKISGSRHFTASTGEFFSVADNAAISATGSFSV